MVFRALSTNTNWRQNSDNYVSHLHIMDEMFAPITTEDRADYLAMLVEDFLEEFKVLYPTRPLTPKMHYLIHIPTWMKLYVTIIIAIHSLIVPWIMQMWPIN